MNQQYALALLVVVAAVVVVTGLRSRASYRRRDVMTPNEVEFFYRLRRALPDLHIFPQVGMAGLIEPIARGRRHKKLFWRVAGKRVDYLLCRQNMSVLGVVELDDCTHDRINDAARDAYLASAGIPTVRFESRHKPAEVQIRAAIAAIHARTS